MSARIRLEGALAAVLGLTLLALPTARAQSCTAQSVYVSSNFYVGGALMDEVRDLQFISTTERPPTKELVVTGQTTSSSLPGGGEAKTAGSNAFVARLNPEDGKARWSFIFGSEGEDFGARVAVGPAGEVYVVGRIEGALPSTPGFKTVYQRALGKSDAFLARLSANGTPEWFMYLATSQEDEALGLALSADAVYVVGKTKANNKDADPFPQVEGLAGLSVDRFGASGTDNNNFDAFLVKVSLSSTPTPVWSRILATSSAQPSANDIAQAVLVQGGDIYFGGRVEGDVANPENIPIRTACKPPASGVVMKVGTDGKGASPWISCLGGTTGGTEIQALLFSAPASLIAVGDTSSSDLPLPGMNGAANRDVFAYTLNASGLPGKGFRVVAPGAQQARGRVTLDPAAQRVFLVGSTDSPLFTDVPPPVRGFDDVFSVQGGDGFVLSLSADLERLEWGSYVGGKDPSTTESVAAVLFDNQAGLFLAGSSSATDLLRAKKGAEPAPALQNGFVFGLTPDMTPPQRAPDKGVEARADARGRLDARWMDVFTDPESGLSRYEWSLFRPRASTPELTDLVEPSQTRAETTSPLEPGEGYTVQVRALNGAGCELTVASPPFDVKPPDAGLPDAGAPDAGPTDPDTADAGSPDAGPRDPGPPASPLGWTCGVTDPGAASLSGPGLLALLGLVRLRARRRATWAKGPARAPSA